MAAWKKDLKKTTAVAVATPSVKLIDETMEITFDKASKFYEPGEKVTGMLNLPIGKFTDIKGKVDIKAECYMDTVSQIRGTSGRPALPEAERTYFMKKDITMLEPIGIGKQRGFEFNCECTVPGEKLLDSYVGVEFSIVYKVIIKYNDRHDKPSVAE